MSNNSATALSCSNIAFIKYWGNQDHALRIPATGSIAMNLRELTTRTRVQFDPTLNEDQLFINSAPAEQAAQQRVGEFLTLVRKRANIDHFARVESENNFPMGTGIASSASAFAALSLAASKAAGMHLDEQGLSRLARRGSGSASRSVPAGFVEWHAGNSEHNSYATSIAPPDHWDLIDCVAIVSQAHKDTGSSDAHPLADSSPVQRVRIHQSEQHLAICRRAIQQRDFEAFAHITELDCHLMHAVMMTSTPALVYWQPTTLAIIQAVQAWRKSGIPVCYTIDAGPNVHVICEGEVQGQIQTLLAEVPGVEDVLVAHPGEGVQLIAD